MTRPIAAILSCVLLIVLSVFSVAWTVFQSPNPYDDVLTQEPAQFAQRYLSLVDAKNWDAVLALSDEDWRNAKARSALATVADMVPGGTPDAIHAAGHHASKSYMMSFSGSFSAEIEDITIEYIYPTKTILATFVLRRDGASFLIQGINVRPLAQPLEQHYEFHFFGQGMLSYVVLAVAVLLFAFNAYALAHCIMMQELKFKWLWIPFVAVGFGAVRYDWTEAAFSYAVAAVSFPSTEFLLSAFQPFIVGMSLPIGAILFMLWRWAHAAYGESDLLEYE